MRQHFIRLARLAQQSERRIIGLMSGTSLDGLDVALCRFSGSGRTTRVVVEAFETVAYNEAFKSKIREVFARQTIDFQGLVLLNIVIAERHAAIVNDCLHRWGVPAAEVDLLASHGQTVFHAPRHFHRIPGAPNATLQIGDGDHLARRTGIITLSDFRQKHLAAGGEGAPLALYGDYFLFSNPDQDRYLLNIGGIANFTFLPADEDPARAFATDTGPGNTLIDAYAQKLFGVPYDRDALLSSAGRVDEGLLARLKEDAFFNLPLPKSTGPEQFSMAWAQAAIEQQPKGNPNPYDLMATLTRLTADTVAEALLAVQAGRPGAQLYTSGGGSHNPLILKYLKEKLNNWQISPMAQLGVDGDAKEAVLFAVLANETLAGDAAGEAILGGVPLVGMGKISLPD
ncbi:MAG: anhydro-N-acetylmuramic acid kinase [Saprospiraceae bacterium]|nr:anhydro-N-acetylmuramic acid kinase [Saprospiraceae bacterium]